MSFSGSTVSTTPKRGGIYYSQRDLALSIKFYEQYLHLACDLSNRHAECNALSNLGMAYAELNDPYTAIEFHNQALAIAREIKDSYVEGNVLGNLGNAYSGLDDYGKATEYYEQSVVVARKRDDQMGEAVSLNNLGLTYLRLGDHNKAIEFCSRAMSLAREIGYLHLEAASNYNLGLALDHAGDRLQAVERVEAALEIYERIKNPAATEARQVLAEWRDSLLSKKQRAAKYGFMPSPHPDADPEGAALLNVRYQEELEKYQQELLAWEALPWWKRLRVRKPIKPTPPWENTLAG